MYYSGITTCDIANGTGVRVVLWCSGCSLHCPGCHNPEEQSFVYGLPFGELAMQTLIDSLAPSYIAGLTISGGHPLEDWNAPIVQEIITTVRAHFPKKTIWIYSGLTWEEIMKNDTYSAIIEQCDVLVDGRFELDKRDITLAFRGSTNQRIIDIKQTLKQNKIVEVMK